MKDGVPDVLDVLQRYAHLDQTQRRGRRAMRLSAERGATVAAGGSLRVRVTAVGEQTSLSGIMRLVAEAQASQSRAQILADRAAALLIFVALAAGG